MSAVPDKHITLQKVSEWVNILQLAVVVFGGGILYQKVELAVNELQTQRIINANIVKEQSDIKVKDAIQDGRINLLEYQVNQEAKK